MRRAVPVLVLLSACKQDVSLSQVEARLAIPTPLVDVSAAVGEELPFIVELQHFRGERVDVLGVEVVNVQGEAFAYTGDEGLSLTSNEVLELPFVYAPDAAGFDTAALFVTTNAADGSFEVTARGRAATPELEVSPTVIDFGAVAAGDTETVLVRIDNLGLESVQVTAGTNDTRFSWTQVGPVTVPAEDSVAVPVQYAPLDTGAAAATLTLSIGAQSFAAVQLRANDCDAGDPALYDADLDGVTGCSGDCDDTDPTVVPGAAEAANGIDDDCDGTIDEGTASHDDDGDGFCEASPCTDGAAPGDCNDADADMHPDGVEVDGNGLDDDCDGTVDVGATDADGDGIAPPTDCDDTDPSVSPAAPEIADGVDNDCDTEVDEDTTAGDDDGDGYCEGPVCEGTASPGDCDDTDPGTHPGATEQPDFVDDDCDGTIDEGTVNEDADGDGFTPAGGDCDDTDPSVNPALGGC